MESKFSLPQSEDCHSQDALWMRISTNRCDRGASFADFLGILNLARGHPLSPRVSSNLGLIFYPLSAIPLTGAHRLEAQTSNLKQFLKTPIAKAQRVTCGNFAEQNLAQNLDPIGDSRFPY
jgi:hypothetical protein